MSETQGDRETQSDRETQGDRVDAGPVGDLSIGIDIGGTKIAGAVVDEAGDIIAEDRVATVWDTTDPSGSDAIVEAVIEMIERLAAGRDIHAAGRPRVGFAATPRVRCPFAFAPRVGGSLCCWRPVRKFARPF